jgi:hypothetical protein
MIRLKAGAGVSAPLVPCATCAPLTAMVHHP